jgi:hypothetical protein
MKSLEELQNTFLGDNGNIAGKNLEITIKKGWIVYQERPTNGPGVLKVKESLSKESMKVIAQYNVIVGGENLKDPLLEFKRYGESTHLFYINISQIEDYRPI